jgi:tRNA(fMet)-specific endonuclease VapC
MKLYVLDTSICGFVQNEHPTVMAALKRAAAQGDAVVTTIITFGEDLGGWLPLCRRAKDGRERARAYARLDDGLQFYRTKECLRFTVAAADIFDELRAQRIRVSTNDLAIAAITLSVNGILVTRNLVDFERVPRLQLEDWTK